MGAGTLQKGALGQQLAASGQARRAEALSRKKTGRGPVGKGRARAVIEDRMDQNDREGKQKQGKGGRPGRSIDGRPPVMKPIEEGGRPFPPKEGRPVEPPMDGRPPSKPIRGDDQYGPGRPGRPIGDDNWATLPYFPGKGPMPGIPEKPIGGRPPVEKQPWGREDDPNYGRKKDTWHQRKTEEWNQRKKEREIENVKRGGTEFGPGKGDRIPRGADKGRPIGNDQLPKGFKGGGFLQDFLARISQLKGGGIR